MRKIKDASYVQPLAEKIHSSDCQFAGLFICRIGWRFGTRKPHIKLHSCGAKLFISRRNIGVDFASFSLSGGRNSCYCTV